jgi:hypothetical protein
MTDAPGAMMRRSWDHPFTVGATVALLKRHGRPVQKRTVDKVYKNEYIVLDGSARKYRPDGSAQRYLIQCDGRAIEPNCSWHPDIVEIWSEKHEAMLAQALAQAQLNVRAKMALRQIDDVLDLTEAEVEALEAIAKKIIRGAPPA